MGRAMRGVGAGVALAAGLCLGGCGVSDSGRATLGPGESLAWTLEGEKVHFRVDNYGPGEVSLTDADGERNWLANKGKYAVKRDHSERSEALEVLLRNESAEPAEVEWSYRAGKAEGPRGSE